MSAATIVQEEYGFRVHTGTSVVLVTRETQYVTAFIFTPIGSNKTVTISNGVGVEVLKIIGVTSRVPVIIEFFNKPIDGIKVVCDGNFSLLILVK